MLAGWVEARRFSTTRLRPGYDREEVDAFLTEIRDSFLGVRQLSLTSGEIRRKCFSTTRLRPGYDEKEVDAFLDEAELWLSAQVLPSGARPGKNNAGPGKNLDGWRVCIAFGDLPRQLKSCRQALIPALRSRLSGQVAVSSNNTQIFLYAPSAGSADEAAQVAREVLARHDVSAHVRTERWSPWEQKWLDAADEPDARIAAEQQAVHEYRQEQERERSVTTRFPAWQVRVELPSHRDVVALAGHLAAQGWRVRPRRRHLIVGADCEDDAKSLARELSGDGRIDADTAFPVGRVSFSYMHAYIDFPTQLVSVDPGRLRVLRPALRARRLDINMATRKKHTRSSRSSRASRARYRTRRAYDRAGDRPAATAPTSLRANTAVTWPGRAQADPLLLPRPLTR
jgi:DivIVA domain-containing protein